MAQEKRFGKPGSSAGNPVTDSQNRANREAEYYGVGGADCYFPEEILDHLRNIQDTPPQEGGGS